MNEKQSSYLGKTAFRLNSFHLPKSKLTLNYAYNIQKNKGDLDVTLNYDGRKYQWEVGECLLQKLESVGIIKQVFPLHGMLPIRKMMCGSGLNLRILLLSKICLFIDEIKRKKLLHTWALQWWDITNQPIDEVYSYFGTKVSLLSLESYDINICLNI